MYIQYMLLLANTEAVTTHVPAKQRGVYVPPLCEYKGSVVGVAVVLEYFLKRMEV